MNNILEYNGYYGSCEFSLDDDILFGKILFINDLVTYEAENISELKNEFENAVNHYVELCKKHNKMPDKSFKGQFNVRISPELHKSISIKSAQENISLNQFVIKALIDELNIPVGNNT